MASPFVGLLLGLQQLAIPSPRGFVNDFAGVLDPGPVARMEPEIAEARDKTGGDFAVVTLPDIGDRPAIYGPVPIGRQRGAGPAVEAAVPRANPGGVALLVPPADL